MCQNIIAVLLVCSLITSAAAAEEPGKLGTLTGRLLVNGEPPRPALLVIPKMGRLLSGEEFEKSDLKKYGGLGLKDETLLVSKVGGLQNAIIWLSDKNVPIPPLPVNKRLPAPVTLTFYAGRLQPRVLAWWALERPLQLVNKEDAAINLRSDSYQGQAFNRVVPADDAVLFPQDADSRPILVRSDIYQWVQPAVIFPCAHPYFAVTDNEGRFALKNLPPGEWEFTAWHERAGWLKTTAWPKGRFQQKIAAEVHDLGEVRIPAALFTRENE
jgi:hypothetical protein